MRRNHALTRASGSSPCQQRHAGVMTVTFQLLVVCLALGGSSWALYVAHKHQRADDALLKSLASEAQDADRREHRMLSMLAQEQAFDLYLAEGARPPPRAPAPAPVDATCRATEHMEYDGSKVLKWGATNLKRTAGECCADCKATPGCNIWVYCGQEQGCSGHQHMECWLKEGSIGPVADAQGFASPAVPWTSGAIFSEAEWKAWQQKEVDRLRALDEDPQLPSVYMDLSIKGELAGRLKIVLFAREAPLAAENFRRLCIGQGVKGSSYSFKGSAIYKIVDRFLLQSGIGSDSAYGGMFRDDPEGMALKHDRKGLLSMANAGPDSNTSHFMILMAPAPHLDNHYVVFGEVVDGFEVAARINSLARGKPEGSAGLEEQVVITDCGQLRGPTSIPLTQ